MHTKPTAPNPPAFTLPRAIRTHECTEADKLLQIHAGPDGPGGAPVHYQITTPHIQDDQVAGFARTIINFQKGPICENGLNGITIESLLAIAHDRLDRFQNGSHPCHENDYASRHIKRAMTLLHNRTRRRQREHAEGTSAPDQEPEAQAPGTSSDLLTRSIVAIYHITNAFAGTTRNINSQQSRAIHECRLVLYAAYEAGQDPRSQEEIDASFDDHAVAAPVENHTP